MIEFEQVSYAYPATAEPALRAVTLVVPQGQICGIVGASGSGKSTFAGAIAGTVPHVTGGVLRGTVRVGGRSVADTPLAGMVTNVGLILQNPFNQISGANYTVRDELAFGLENLGVERSAMARRIDEVLDELRIGHLADRSPFALSGGQQQLVAIGSVLVMGLGVWVLDEPTSQLDPDSATLVFAALDRLRSKGTTIVIVENRVERLAELADRVVVLSHGEVVLDGPPGDVLTDVRLLGFGVPVTRYTGAARLAAERDLWPEHTPLPVSLPDTVRGFRAVLDPAMEA